MSPSILQPDHRKLAAEIKFLISPELAEVVRAWTQSRLAPDPHGRGFTNDAYRITSLYLETPSFDVYRRRDSYGRAKYRIRRYGEETTCFLERKFKAHRMLTKRRTPAGLDSLQEMDAEGDRPEWESGWFKRRLQLRGLRPVCQISYHRTARVGMTPDGPIRLTLDDDLRALPADAFSFRNEGGQCVLPRHVVLELKYLVQMPALFKQLVAEFSLSSRKFSKYRRSAFVLGLCSLRDVAAEVPEVALASSRYA